MLVGRRCCKIVRCHSDMLDVNAMLGGEGLECSLGGDGLNGGVINLDMNESQTRVVVHKDGRAPVALPGKVLFSWVKNPTSVDAIWLTETVSPGLVATKR